MFSNFYFGILLPIINYLYIHTMKKISGYDPLISTINNMYKKLMFFKYSYFFINVEN